MPQLPTYIWIALVVIVVMVVYRFLKDLDKKRDAKQLLQDKALEEKWIAQGVERQAAWAAWNAEVDRQIAALEDHPTEPPFVISLLTGEDYPCFGVFVLTVETSHRARPTFGPPRSDGQSYPGQMPPVELPDIFEVYMMATDRSFDTREDAKVWLDFLIDDASRQTAFDEDLQPIGPYDARDVEGEAGVR